MRIAKHRTMALVTIAQFVQSGSEIRSGKCIFDWVNPVGFINVNPVVVRELRNGQPLCPVALMVIDADPQVLLYLLVDPFRLPIGLWVVGSGGIPFDVQQLVKILHEARVKLGAPVMDDLLGDAMELEHMIAIQPCHAL